MSHETERAYLYKTGVDQDTSADRVHNTADGRSSRGSRIVSRPNTQTCGNTNRGGEAVHYSTSNWDPAMFFFDFEEGETGANPETLKGFCMPGELRRPKKSGDGN